MPDGPRPRLTVEKSREPHVTATSSDKASLAGLLRRLADDSRSLVQQELALVRLEVQQTLSGVLRAAGAIAVGTAFLAVGLLVLLAFLIIGLAELLNGAYWLSTLLVGGGLVLVGLVALFTGLKRLSRTDFSPAQSADELRETGEWAQAELRDIKRDLAP